MSLSQEDKDVSRFVNTLRTLVEEDREQLKTENSELDSAVSALEKRLLEILTQARDENHSGTPDKVPDLTGRRIGPYKVERSIAMGGMGHVYRAYRADGEFHQTVAIKIVEQGNLKADLFRHERQTLADLDNSNIVRLLDGGTLEEGFPYLVMEYIDGLTVDRYVEVHEADVRTRVKLVAQLAKILRKAHNKGVIHCDIKPGNILVTHEGEIKLVDFGIARVVNRTRSDALSSLLCKAMTPVYSSPQRCQNEIPSITDDVYSLGILLAHLITGKPPVHDADQKDYIENARIIRREYKKRIEDKELRAIFLQATVQNEDDRYVSVYALGKDLGNWLDGAPVEAFDGDMFYRVRQSLKGRRLHAFLISLILLGMVWQSIQTFFVGAADGQEALAHESSNNMSGIPESSKRGSSKNEFREGRGKVARDGEIVDISNIIMAERKINSLGGVTLATKETDHEDYGEQHEFIHNFFNGKNKKIKHDNVDLAYDDFFTADYKDKVAFDDFSQWWAGEVEGVYVYNLKSLGDELVQADFVYQISKGQKELNKPGPQEAGVIFCSRNIIHLKKTDNGLKIDGFEKKPLKICMQRVQQLMIHAIQDDEIVWVEKLAGSMDDIDFYDPVWEKTPLQVAAYHGKLEIAKFLVEKRGANLDLRSKDEENLTALGYAKKYKYTDLADYLAKKIK